MYRYLIILDVTLICVALGHWPYGYYEILRLVSCPIFAFGANLSYKLDRTAPLWVFGTLAVLYNPLIKVHLQRESWQLVNIATIGFLLVMLWKLPSWERANRVPEAPTKP